MPDAPHRYFVTCHKGLEEATATELRGEPIAAQEVAAGSSGVHFSGPLAVGYRANLWLRSGIRVLDELCRARVVGPEELYAWAREIPWPRYMAVAQTFSVEARVWDSALTHSKYAALRIKDALCDSFRARAGRRPDVDVHQADLPLFLYLHRDEAILYRDLSGATLHKRGYRDVLHRSPLNEALAAGILILAGYDGEGGLADPMCGAGTFAIEAALLALQRAPGLSRKDFPFQRWPDFDKALWKDCRARAFSRARYELPGAIAANDHHAGALSLARKDAESAGVASFIQFSQADIAEFVPPDGLRLVVVNPPWGRRLAGGEVKEAWRKLGRFLETRCRGARAWVLAGEQELPRELGLPPARTLILRTGKVECRLHCFVL
jgi:putative N6-adenine-specific DNA methylase